MFEDIGTVYTSNDNNEMVDQLSVNNSTASVSSTVAQLSTLQQIITQPTTADRSALITSVLTVPSQLQNPQQAQLSALQAVMQQATPRQTTTHQLVYQQASSQQMNGLLAAQVRPQSSARPILPNSQSTVQHLLQTNALNNQYPTGQQNTQPQILQQYVHHAPVQSQRVQQQQVLQQRVPQHTLHPSTSARTQVNHQVVSAAQQQLTQYTTNPSLITRQISHIVPLQNNTSESGVHQQVQQVFQAYSSAPQKVFATNNMAANVPISTSTLSSVLHSKNVNNSKLVASQKQAVVMASPDEDLK